MHYKNGREAKVGDPILSVDSGGWASLGIVTKLYTCSNSCNLQIVPLRNQVCVTARECVHIDDAFTVPQEPAVKIGNPFEEVTSPAAPIPGASPAQLASPEVPVIEDKRLPEPDLCARNLPPTVVHNFCPDCHNDDGTHTKGCAQYQ